MLEDQNASKDAGKGSEELPNRLSAKEATRRMGLLLRPLSRLGKPVPKPSAQLQQVPEAKQAPASPTFQQKQLVDVDTSAPAAATSKRPAEDTISPSLSRSLLEERLRSWRQSRAKALRQTPKSLLPDQVVVELASLQPTSILALGQVSGLPVRKAQQHGHEILDIIKDHIYGVRSGRLLASLKRSKACKGDPGGLDAKQQQQQQQAGGGGSDGGSAASSTCSLGAAAGWQGQQHQHPQQVGPAAAPGQHASGIGDSSSDEELACSGDAYGYDTDGAGHLADGDAAAGQGPSGWGHSAASRRKREFDVELFFSAPRRRRRGSRAPEELSYRVLYEYQCGAPEPATQAAPSAAAGPGSEAPQGVVEVAAAGAGGSSCRDGDPGRGADSSGSGGLANGDGLGLSGAEPGKVHEVAQASGEPSQRDRGCEPRAVSRDDALPRLPAFDVEAFFAGPEPEPGPAKQQARQAASARPAAAAAARCRAQQAAKPPPQKPPVKAKPQPRAPTVPALLPPLAACVAGEALHRKTAQSAQGGSGGPAQQPGPSDQQDGEPPSGHGEQPRGEGQAPAPAHHNGSAAGGSDQGHAASATTAADNALRRNGQYYSEAEDTYIVDQVAQGQSVPQIALSLRRSVSAVKYRLQLLLQLHRERAGSAIPTRNTGSGTDNRAGTSCESGSSSDSDCGSEDGGGSSSGDDEQQEGDQKNGQHETRQEDAAAASAADAPTEAGGPAAAAGGSRQQPAPKQRRSRRGDSKKRQQQRHATLRQRRISKTEEALQKIAAAFAAAAAARRKPASSSGARRSAAAAAAPGSDGELLRFAVVPLQDGRPRSGRELALAQPPEDLAACSAGQLRSFLLEAGVDVAAMEAAAASAPGSAGQSSLPVPLAASSGAKGGWSAASQQQQPLLALAQGSLAAWEVQRVLACNSLPAGHKRHIAVLRCLQAGAQVPKVQLHLGGTASPDAIKAAFKRLSLLTHPDKGHGDCDRARAAFQMLQQARDELLKASA